jgi:tRNA wybutosine-synthesizing protein 2
MIKTPYEQIKTILTNDISPDLIDYLPEKWEKIGTILIIKLNKRLQSFKKKIGKIYAEVLQCKTVLQDIGGITGVYRKPNVDIIYGLKNTETTHKENGILYKLDLQDIMFSSGNMNERKRMANISNKNETVVDLFAGIGYFTLPMAVYSKPKKIYSCEINPIAYKYLCQNIIINHVTSIVTPLFGDNREIAPKNVADRVLLGFLEKSYEFISTAIASLKNCTGIIHYHDVFPNILFSQRASKIVNDIAKQYQKKVTLLEYKTIKSYAPGISHVVVDIMIGDK